ncbi:hypothetical protein D3C72_1863850 [compost metagenome]
MTAQYRLECPAIVGNQVVIQALDFLLEQFSRQMRGAANTRRVIELAWMLLAVFDEVGKAVER